MRKMYSRSKSGLMVSRTDLRKHGILCYIIHEALRSQFMPLLEKFCDIPVASAAHSS